jgi:hypothetical protein
MRVETIEWDRFNRAHFAEHGRCREHEVEDILLARCYPSRARDQPGAQPRKRFQGRACNDRYLAVIAAVQAESRVRPITCWPLEGQHLDNYLAWQRSLPR